MLRRAALFTDEPVMAAEFDYGALGSGTLTAEEEYGDDDWYGLDDDDDDDDVEFGALGSESLAAEEEYGDDDEYGLDDDDDDDDDDFGAWYGEEDDDDDIGLSDLEADVDEDLYGAWYGAETLAARVAASGISAKGMATLEDAVGNGAVLLPQFLQESPTGKGVIDDILELVASVASPGDYEEIAAYIASFPNFGNWNVLTLERQMEIVRNAVAQAAIPGIEMTAPARFLDAFEQHYQGGFFSAAKAGGFAAIKGAWALATSDVPRAWAAVLGDLPLTGKMLGELQQALGKPNWDDMVNPTAIGYALVGFANPNIYRWLAESISQRAQLAITEAKAAEGGYQTVDLMPAAPIPTVVQPPQAVPVAAPTMPRPQTVLAGGYALMVAGSLLGVFSG